MNKKEKLEELINEQKSLQEELNNIIEVTEPFEYIQLFQRIAVMNNQINILMGATITEEDTKSESIQVGINYESKENKDELIDKLNDSISGGIIIK